ncbi:LLM class flavin-dependent oxidoreductase [Pseudonocardia halophobica]|uniref:LLM class flavin-dependent oxidoreductase n=1 Tax=Pseudonocardia halophobica TaxID=29401 RepID=UPI0034DB5AAE
MQIGLSTADLPRPPVTRGRPRRPVRPPGQRRAPVLPRAHSQRVSCTWCRPEPRARSGCSARSRCSRSTPSRWRRSSPRRSRWPQAGRFEFGVGGEFPREFEATDVHPTDRFRRLDEGLRVLRALFTGNRVTLHCEFTTLRDLVRDPPPVQPGGPPIWLGGARRARCAAPGATPTFGRPPWSSRRSSPARSPGSASTPTTRGTTPPPCPVPSSSGRAWTPDGAWARETGIAAVSRTYAHDFGRLADRYLVLGGPARVGRAAARVRGGRSRPGGPRVRVSARRSRAGTATDIDATWLSAGTSRTTWSPPSTGGRWSPPSTRWDPSRRPRRSAPCSRTAQGR